MKPESKITPSPPTAQDLRRMADNEQPHSRISIQQALGRAWLRRRRTTMVGAPALVAAAAAAIALTSPAQAAVGSRATPQSGPAAAPRHFSAYSAYAGFGWLPGHLSETDGAFNTRWDLLSAYSSPWTLLVGAAGECHLAHRDFTCASSPVATTQTRPAPAVNGHRAYWALEDRQPGVPHRFVGGLIWQYESGGWAWLGGGPTRSTPIANKRKLRHIARTVTFGGHHPSLGFAVELTRLPARWHIDESYFEHPLAVKWADGFVITNGRESLSVGMGLNSRGSNACHPRLGRLGWYCQVIHGYHVAVSRPVREGRHKPFVQVLTAPNADGLYVQITVTGRKRLLGKPLSTAALFRDMTILGNNPADWTTKPIS
jgi:hypothetical protein